MKLIVYQGFCYQWDSSAFLNETQALYAIKQLWKLTAGSANWDAAVAITFKAIKPIEIEQMLDAPCKTMPWIPLEHVSPLGWRSPLDTHSLPAICHVASTAIAYEGRTPFPLDLVAATFIQLTRWEEWSRPDLDQFGCHKEDSSVAARQGFRDRPVLDEWALVLRAWLKKEHSSWHELMRPYRVDFSHDIDILRYYKNPLWIARRCARNFLKEKCGLASLNVIPEGIAALLNPARDPCVMAFNTLMDFSESLNTRSTFFFMAAMPGRFDDGYAVDSVFFKSLGDRIRSRGHRIGWHPSFEAAERDSIFDEELARLSQAIDSSTFGVRHHFLRWRAGYTWKRLALKGIPFDASIGYNYHLGFRASTSQSFEAYDLIADSALDLEIQPLIVMDGPLQRDPISIKENVALFARRCAAVHGCLTILVHNYSLMNNQTLLTAIAEGLDTGKGP